MSILPCSLSLYFFILSLWIVADVCWHINVHNGRVHGVLLCWWWFSPGHWSSQRCLLKHSTMITEFCHFRWAYAILQGQNLARLVLCLRREIQILSMERAIYHACILEWCPGGQSSDLWQTMTSSSSSFINWIVLCELIIRIAKPAKYDWLR